MKKNLIQIIISAILFAIGLLVPFSNGWITKGIYIGAYLIVGLEIIIKAIKNIFKGEVFDEHFLMAVATIGAFAIGEFPEAVAVMLFYQIGELFQDYAVDKSKESITNLMDIRPDVAVVKRNGKLETLKPETVKIGEEIVVKPGEKIPLDGTIIDGSSMLDTSALTGESVPRSAKIGEKVLSGCINQSGVLTIKVEKEFGESTVSKILDLVENASNKKSKSENFITKFAKIYTPTVVGIAILLAIIPPFLLKWGSFSEWLERALTFLVVSCPCALVISIPLGFFGGIGGASRKGVLIKGSNYLELLSKTDIFVFDKTGTLTEGVFEVQKINPVDISEEELLKIAAYAESYSNHPISASIKKAYQKEINQEIIEKTEEISGKGIISQIENKTVVIGNNKIMQEKGIEYKECNDIGTILYVAVNNKFEGSIVIADKIKEDAKQTIQGLKRNNVSKTVMLTGDKKEIAEKVAKQIEIGEVYTDLLPDQKVEKVEELMKQKTEKGKLAFVGDGINDAPVLAISDIGIAMGGLGSDAAIEAADIVIMNDKPSKILEAIKISNKTMRIVKQNIIFAISVKILVLILGACGIATMWEAVFADVGVSFIAILNSLRALGIKKA
ncbi:MAG: cadmium-translocating P-type ATPase [Clostridiales bacterium]|nr:cadmium-translocating P-type ATPase [Clostridiales bacterium]